VAAAGISLGFCRRPGGSGVSPGPSRVSRGRVAIYGEDAILTAPGTKFLRRSFAIKPHMGSLFTLSAAFFLAIGCGSYHGSGSSFLVVPEFLTLLLNGLVPRGSGTQVVEAGDIIEAYVQLILWMHVLVQSVYLIFLGEASGPAHVRQHDRGVVERLWALHTALNLSHHLCSVSPWQVLLSKFSTKFFPGNPGSVVAVPEQSFTSE